MKKEFFVFLFIMSLIGGCDVNFENLALPNNEASYRIKLLNEKYDIATELSKYTTGIKPNEKGELCLDTIVAYNEGSKISFGKVQYSNAELKREPPFYLSGVADKNFDFVLKDLNSNVFNVLDNGSASLTFDDFTFAVQKSTYDLNEPYLVFQSVDILFAKLKLEANNQTGFNLTSLKVKICNLEGQELCSFELGALSKGAVLSDDLNLTGKTFNQYILLKVEGKAIGGANVPLDKNNKLSLSVSFENTNGYQIQAVDYVGKMEADTVEFSWLKEVKIDCNANGISDFDIYNAQTTYNIENKLNLSIENFSNSPIVAFFSFPDVQSSKYLQDTLKSNFTILGKYSNDESRITEKSIYFSDKYLGESYAADADLVDTMRVVSELIFPKTNNFVRASEQKVEVNMELASLEIEEMECKVKEDVVFGENNGVIPVDLHRLKVTDKEGKEVKELKMLGEPQISFQMKPIVNSKKNFIADIIDFKTQMKTSRGTMEKLYNDSLILDVFPASFSENYFGNLPNDIRVLDLLGILPEKLVYNISPTLRATDSVVTIKASENMNVKIHISSPITFDTQGDSLIFELREDYGDGFEGMRKEFHSAKIKKNMYDNYIDGKFILSYKNTSNMLLAAKVIICSEKSMLYSDDIQTNATVETVGTDGYPDYIARVIQINNLQPNTSSAEVSAQLSQRDLEPFLMDSSFVGVKISICSSSASFAGELDLSGNMEFIYNNFGDL